MIFFFPARTILACMTLQIFFLSNNYSFISVVSVVVEITGRGGNQPECSSQVSFERIPGFCLYLLLAADEEILFRKLTVLQTTQMQTTFVNT